MTQFSFAARLSALEPYRPSPPSNKTMVALHANEGRAPVLNIPLHELPLNLYPKAAKLEAQIAKAYQLDPSQVVVTAGADDALLRLALSFLEPGRKAALLNPTFEMLPRYVQFAGGTSVSVPWFDRRFPLAEYQTAMEEAALGYVVTPASPSGEVCQQEDLLVLAESARVAGSVLVIDLAYIEFADLDPTRVLLEHGHAVVTRTFSKALGLAGLRVGYALGPSAVMTALRTVGQPFAVSGPSLLAAEAAFQKRDEIASAAKARVQKERAQLFKVLAPKAPIASQANFVLSRWGPRGPEVVASLAEMGFKVRGFSAKGLEGTIRITCPQDETVMDALVPALEKLVKA